MYIERVSLKLSALTNNPNNGVVLISGGMDSVTLLYHIKNLYPEATIHAITMYYGQRHRKEMFYSRYWCKKLNIPFHDYKLGFIGDITKDVSSMIGASKIDVPNEEYDSNKTPSTYVPFRNAIFTMIAASYCESNNLTNIYYAGHVGDSGANYWDCSMEYYDKVNSLLALRGIVLRAPFLSKTKVDIAKVAKQYKDLHLEKTWSCYNGNDIHCGTCSTCRERILAMKGAGIVDKTSYVTNPYILDVK